MKRKISSRQQVKPARRRMTNFISFVKLLYAKRKLVAVILGVVLVVVSWRVGYVDLAYQYGTQKSQDALKRLGFRVKNVLVEGREHTSFSEISASLGVRRGSSIFSLNPEQAQKHLENLSWVNSAMVRRNLPHTIYIRLVERQPLAIWQTQGKRRLIDTKGVVIGDFKSSDFKHLIVLTGKEANKNASDLLNILADFPEFQRKVKAATFISGRRWDLVLDNKVRIKLPEKNVKNALERLEKMHNEYRLANGDIGTIDLRLEDRSFLYVKDNEHDKKDKGKLT